MKDASEESELRSQTEVTPSHVPVLPSRGRNTSTQMPYKEAEK
jgi:hypothetical protein